MERKNRTGGGRERDWEKKEREKERWRQAAVMVLINGLSLLIIGCGGLTTVAGSVFMWPALHQPLDWKTPYFSLSVCLSMQVLFYEAKRQKKHNYLYFPTTTHTHYTSLIVRGILGLNVWALVGQLGNVKKQTQQP